MSNTLLPKEMKHKPHGLVSLNSLVSIQKPTNSLEGCLINKAYLAVKSDFLVL